ncbi:UDP-N-acetylglucosamine 1-carboxyvinyltransferase [Garciella nitratireducens]|uniref:UDP-N-acetylglucosamine 1-carboxyvinyltransferase n=1 Tax=Garciella nitratireducens DSM 15102 TaxID=1121911 RepID=A0A1T4JT70_9FIRM|nr:UDP-N-acetylglucosamine 1-carboxyvinyltransferase [Garciella nitratireducens]SJZ33402.1 UDP-N-acetylglucosamine 1-carboxyvinyltransferase [Garciella nitratireducens DSM 15102]
MGQFYIKGGIPLEGELRVQGAKNAVLPILAATILNQGESVIHNVPDLKDVKTMIKILESIGCSIKKEENTLIVNSSAIHTNEIPEYLVREMRSSIILLGAILAKHKQAKFSYPGGCDIGHRPIDLHLKSFRELGAEVMESHGYIYCKSNNLKGTHIQLDYPSVGATENIMLAASLTEGITIIRNAAKEPEIQELQNFLNKMGCKIKGAGSNTIIIEGVKKLNNVEFTIMSDRIVAGTFAVAAAITGGQIVLKDCYIEHISSVISKLIEAGCNVYSIEDKIVINSSKKIKAVETIRTLPYPGFPTDMQAQMMALMTVAKGTSIFTETIFENRYKHVSQLIRMGANINIDGRIAVVKGVNKLFGAKVTATDLRGGAALVLAGLSAEGETIVDNIYHVDRGYEKFEENLQSLGASIIRKE